MAAKKKAVEAVDVKLPPLEIQRMKVRVKGVGPLVMHAWDTKVLQQIEEKQTGRATKGRAPKDTVACYTATRYVHDGKDCMLAVHFKKAMMSAAGLVDMFKTTVQKTLYVRGSLKGGEYVPILGCKPQMRRDPVRINNGRGTDLRYRAEYIDWRAEFVVEFNARAITAEQILNLLSVAGFSCGIGENRPSKSGGDWGRFELDMGNALEAAAE